MNIGDYLHALEKIGIKFIATSDINELKRLYTMHVLPKPQRDCFKQHVNSKRVVSGVSSKKVKRIKLVKKESVVSKAVTNNTSRGETEKGTTKSNLKRVQFSDDVTVSEYVKPKFQKTAVSWP